MTDGVPVFSNVQAKVIAKGQTARKVGSRANAIILAIALCMPVLIHMAPWGGGVPLGAFLLPMFWVAFVAVYLYGPWVGLLVALLGPTVNTFLTRFPAIKFNIAMTFELAVFVLFAWLVIRTPRGRAFWLLAPLSYVVAKTCSSGLRAAGVSFLGDIGSAGEFFLRSVTNGAPGLLILAVINFALVRGWFGNSSDGGHGPQAA